MRKLNEMTVLLDLQEVSGNGTETGEGNTGLDVGSSTSEWWGSGGRRNGDTSSSADWGNASTSGLTLGNGDGDGGGWALRRRVVAGGSVGWLGAASRGPSGSWGGSPGRSDGNALVANWGRSVALNRANVRGHWDNLGDNGRSGLGWAVGDGRSAAGDGDDLSGVLSGGGKSAVTVCHGNTGEESSGSEELHFDGLDW